MLVFGENTYKGMAAYWPTAEAEGEVTALMNSIPKGVCSTSLEKAEWNNTTIIRDTIPELKRLKEEGAKPIYIFGSGQLAQSLMNAGMIDEIRLCIAPIILGKGRRLFTDEISHAISSYLNLDHLKMAGLLFATSLSSTKKLPLSQEFLSL